MTGKSVTRFVVLFTDVSGVPYCSCW